MPDKKIFAIRLRRHGKNVVVRVMQIVFPNGCVFYKIVRNDSFWLINVNDKWRITAAKMPETGLLNLILNAIKRMPAGQRRLHTEK